MLCVVYFLFYFVYNLCMLYISIFCIFCRFFCLLTIKIFFPPPKKKKKMRTLTTNEVDVKGVTSFIWSLYGHNTSHINDARYNVFIRLTRGGIQAHTRNIKKINCASPPPPPHVRNLWKSIYKALSMWLRSGKGVMHQIQQIDLKS